ncbi:hypothetical protein [Rhizobium sp. SSA_523]|nr:hypothetical protein [Rhizobium sp. SSA_523]WKC24790.1 hypothetical protein QTJ18_12260 [Rhizobium sp. SSA_523]
MNERRRDLFDFIYQTNMMTGTLRAILFFIGFAILGGTFFYLIG